MIHITCPHCGQEANVRESHAGLEKTCKCGAKIQVPSGRKEATGTGRKTSWKRIILIAIGIASLVIVVIAFQRQDKITSILASWSDKKPSDPSEQPKPKTKTSAPVNQGANSNSAPEESQPSLPGLASDDISVQRAAVLEVATLGSKASDSLDALKLIRADKRKPELRALASAAIYIIDPSDDAILVNTLNADILSGLNTMAEDGESVLRAKAIDTAACYIGMSVPSSNELGGGLVKIDMTIKDANVEKAIDIWIKASADKEVDIRRSAVLAMFATASSSAKVIPSIMRTESSVQTACKDSDLVVRGLAKQAIGIGSPNDEDRRAGLTYATEHYKPFFAKLKRTTAPPNGSDEQVNESLTKVLMAPFPEEATMNDVVNRSGDIQKAMRPGSQKDLDALLLIFSLGGLGQFATLSPGKEPVDVACMAVALAIPKYGKAAIPKLIENVRDFQGMEDLIFWSITALEKFGPDAIDALPVLEKALTDESERIQRAAKAAITAIDPNWKQPSDG